MCSSYYPYVTSIVNHRLYRWLSHKVMLWPKKYYHKSPNKNYCPKIQIFSLVNHIKEHTIHYNRQYFYTFNIEFIWVSGHNWGWHISSVLQRPIEGQFNKLKQFINIPFQSKISWLKSCWSINRSWSNEIRK